MKPIKIVIVDDSPFQISVLTDLLNESGFSVIGSASSLGETKEVVKNLKPDLVTMDMTIPGTDGLECTRAIHEIDPNIKVIIISSMMDDEIIREAKKNHASSYIQKPVDKEELSLIINRIMANEELFDELEGFYNKAFKESILDIFNKLTKTIPNFTNEKNINAEFNSQGISIVLGIIGKYSGRIIFDMSSDTAENFSKALLKRAPKSTEETLNVMGEISNMISGNVCSMINKKNKLFGLRVAPPTVFHGESLSISKGEFAITYSAKATTAYGEIDVNIGFKRSEGEWTSNI